MALKYGITTKTFEPVAAESILDSVEGMNSALQDIAQYEGRLAEAEVVMENLQKALDTISEFGVGEESLGILDSDGSLQAVLNLQAPALESLESMSEQALEALDQKWEKALEGAMSDAWEKVKKFFKELWAKIKDYALRFWNWLKGLFTKNKSEAAKAKAETAEVQQEAAKAPAEAKTEVAKAPAKVIQETASCPSGYKDALELVKAFPGVVKTAREGIASLLGLANQLATKGGAEASKAELEKGISGMYQAVHDLYANLEADNKKYAKSGIQVKVSGTAADADVAVSFEVKPPEGNATQLGWKSQAEFLKFIEEYAKIDPNQALSNKILDDVEKKITALLDGIDADNDDENIPESVKEKAKATRKAAQLSTMFVRQLLAYQNKMLSHGQTIFNWAKEKNAKINSAIRAAINS